MEEEKNSFWSKIIIVIVVAFIAHKLWQDHKERKASLSWPSTPGKITNSYLKETTRTNDDNDTKIISFGNTTTDYQVAVRYTYAVDGVNYSGNRITVSEKNYSSQSDAAYVLAGYKEDTKETVYYNPQRPGVSVLLPGQ